MSPYRKKADVLEDDEVEHKMERLPCTYEISGAASAAMGYSAARVIAAVCGIIAAAIFVHDFNRSAAVFTAGAFGLAIAFEVAYRRSIALMRSVENTKRLKGGKT